MTNYEYVLKSVFHKATFKAKKEVKNLDDFSEIISSYIINDEVDTKEKLDVISTMSEQIYFTSENIEEHINAMIYINELIEESYKQEIEDLEFEIKRLKGGK